MNQEVQLEVRVIFNIAQIESTNSTLNKKLASSIQKESVSSEFPIIVDDVESSMQDAYIKLTTSINAEFSTAKIKYIIEGRLRKILYMGLAKVEVLDLKEEAKIYGNA